MRCLIVDPFPTWSMYPLAVLRIHLLSCFLKHVEETKSNKSRNKRALVGWCQPPQLRKRRGTLRGQSDNPTSYFLGTSCGPCNRLGPLRTLARQSSQQPVGSLLLSAHTGKRNETERWIGLSKLHQGKPGFNSHLPDSNTHVFIVISFMVMSGEVRCFPNADVHTDFSAMNLAGLSSRKARAPMSSDSEPSLT